MPAPGPFYEPWKRTAGEWITLDHAEGGEGGEGDGSGGGAVSMMSHELGRAPKLFRPVAANLYDVEERLRDMDRDGVRLHVTIPNPTSNSA